MYKFITLFCTLVLLLTACQKTTEIEESISPDTDIQTETITEPVEIISTPVYTIPDDVKLVDSQAFAGVDTDVITEIIVHEEVGAMDFVYLNSLPSLRKITLDEDNPHYKSITGESYQTPPPEECIIMSMASTEIFYIPDLETNRIYMERTPITEQYPKDTEIRLYTRGVTIDVYYTYSNGREYIKKWYMTDIRYVPKGTTYSPLTVACPENVQIDNSYGLSVFPVTEGMVVSQIDFGYSSYEPVTYVFTEKKVLTCPHPQHTWAAHEARDQMLYYPGENGALLYTRTCNYFVGQDERMWANQFIFSPDQYWKEDGTVTWDNDTFLHTPTKFYTITDFFATFGTTMEEEYRKIQEKNPDTCTETWEERMQNSGRILLDMCSVHHVAYHTYDDAVINYIDEIHGEGAFMAWIGANSEVPWNYFRDRVCTHATNIVSCLRHFEVPKAFFEETYYTYMYYVHRYDPDILYSGDDAAIDEYFTIDSQYPVDPEVEIRSCIWELKTYLCSRLKTMDLPAEIKEKYTRLGTDWTFPQYILDTGMTKEEFIALLDEKTPVVPKRPNKNTYGSMYVEPAIYINSLFDVNEIFGFTKYTIVEDAPEYIKMKEIEEAETAYERARLVLELEKTFLNDMDEIRFGQSTKERIDPAVFSKK